MRQVQTLPGAQGAPVQDFTWTVGVRGGEGIARGKMFVSWASKPKAVVHWPVGPQLHKTDSDNGLGDYKVLATKFSLICGPFWAQLLFDSLTARMPTVALSTHLLCSF